jgi:hypothetical protein
MLKNRLFFGTLMTVLFLAVVIFDGWLDGSITATDTDNKDVQGTIFCILVALLAIPAQLEFSKLAAAKKLKIFVPVSIIASILLAFSALYSYLHPDSPVYLSISVLWDLRRFC